MKVASMGDLSAEPSMEEILSSIKRIIAEEGEGATQRTRRPQRAPLAAVPSQATRTPGEPDEVLELSEPMAALERIAPETTAPEHVTQEDTAREHAGPENSGSEHMGRDRGASSAPTPRPEPVQIPSAAGPIVSQRAAAASRGSLDALTRVVVKPEGASATDNPLEAMVREMLRPMLSEWLDAKLPDIVEAMVAREIERITGSKG